MRKKGYPRLCIRILISNSVKVGLSSALATRDVRLFREGKGEFLYQRRMFAFLVWVKTQLPDPGLYGKARTRMASDENGRKVLEMDGQAKDLNNTSVTICLSLSLSLASLCCFTACNILSLPSPLSSSELVRIEWTNLKIRKMIKKDKNYPSIKQKRHGDTARYSSVCRITTSQHLVSSG